ncbi:uncharacterized protein LOC122258688 [Penaeus japonicus]|uniref:uncharacterized protein LOC122258688 n=1 Tax=Penaeus japonicus TaxID=27405 RepID=UPI001C70B86B|nr:uncharacterized protein LOC122258688 [Penaeus japonicus]
MVAILTREPRALPTYLFVVRPFTVGSWLAVLASIFAMGTAFWALQLGRCWLFNERDIGFLSAQPFGCGVLLEDPPFNGPRHTSGRRISRLQERLLEAGLVEHWVADVLETHFRKNQKETGSQVEDGKSPVVSLKIHHLQGALYLLFLGHSIATLTFIVEKWHRCNHHRHSVNARAVLA